MHIQIPLRVTREGRALKNISECYGVIDVFKMLHPTKVDFTHYSTAFVSQRGLLL